MDETRREFVEYVLSYYGDEEEAMSPPMTREEAERAAVALMADVEWEDDGFATRGREIVRDMVLRMRGGEPFGEGPPGFPCQPAWREMIDRLLRVEALQ